DEAKRADHFIVLHRLGKEAARIRSAQADGGLPRGRDGAGHALIEQSAEDHYRHVPRLPVGDPQPVDEPAFDTHALKRGGEDLSATMHHQQLMPLLGKLRNLSAQRANRFWIVQQSTGNLHDHSHWRPVASSKPIIAFMFCTAWPAAPLPRLSRQLTTTRRSPLESRAKPMSQKFVCATCWSSGRRPDGHSLTMGFPA